MPPMETPESSSERSGSDEPTAVSDAGANIRRRIEYRQLYTDELIHAKDVKSFEDDEFSKTISPESHEPIFELLQTFYLQSKLDTSTDPDQARLQKAASSTVPVISMRILSPAIINALRSVVLYYPSQDLSGESIIVKHPYAVLVHHYEELAKFRDRCAQTPMEELCTREREASVELDALLTFLDTEIMPGVRAEQERNKRGFETFEHFWVALKPGTTILTKLRTEAKDDFSRGYVIKSVRDGSFVVPARTWMVEYWKLEYDGVYLGRHESIMEFHKFDGEEERNTKMVEAENILAHPEACKLVENGKKFWDLLGKHCRYYKGKSKQFPYNEIDGLVMVDVHAHYADNVLLGRPELMSDKDLRNWQSDCQCTTCKATRESSNNGSTPIFDDYNLITHEQWEGLTDHQYLLCPTEIHAFVFRTRAWETLDVRNLEEPRFDEAMISNLVMNPARLDSIKSLVKSFARFNRKGEEIKERHWGADFVKGKGHGLTFLLHGSPGVGKTCTAECVAEFIGRPLMVLTSSDIGTSPTEVEERLTKKFKSAMSWGAVLLIDEADVFMERRSSHDLTRNSLVAAFLRALEFYDGILFLTTNRVGEFDDAFISRIHIQIYYPPFTDEERQKIWKTFVDKLTREKGNYIRLNIDAKEYLAGKEMREIKWNGREIRNAFQTAVALAEFDAEKDDDGKIKLTDKHLRAVLELSKDFKLYLSDLHKKDEGKRAEFKKERLDSYETKS